MKKIALILSTDGVEYDDRVRKEILSVRRYFPDLCFHIFAIVRDNHAEKGVTDYGIPYEYLKLNSREKYSSGSKLLIKLYDFYKTIKPKIKEFDYVWCADIHTVFIVALCNKPLIWDLHELPLYLSGNRIKRLIYNFIAHRPKVILHANQARIDYLKKLGMCRNPEKNYFLRNYPSFNESEVAPDNQFADFKSWNADFPCVYLQGLDGDRRAAYESVAAVIDTPGLHAVVVGKFNFDIKSKLLEKYPSLNQRVYFTGMVKQQQTPLYIRHCFCSLVFYKNISPNNWYCEANRFYQNVVNGKPVIVGANPSMSDLVNKYSLGIATKTDGVDINEIRQALKELIDNYEYYKNNVLENKNLFNWESQDEKIKEVVNKLLDY